MSATTSKPLITNQLPSGRNAGTASLYRLAWRNIWRQKRRTALLIIVVAYASLSTIFFWGITDGQVASVVSNQARFLIAPALITTTRYQDDPDPENALPDLAFTAGLNDIAGVRGSAPRIDFPALLRSPYTSETALVRGIDPALEPQVSDIPEKITQGRMLQDRGEVVLGRELAESIDVRLGERLAIDASALDGPQAAGLRVVGLIDSHIAAVDQNTVLIHLDDARALTGVTTATGVALDIARGQEKAVAARVQEQLPEDLGAYDVLTLLGAISQDLDNNVISMIPIGLLFAIFAALAVTSTVLVSVMERSRELGMMASIGLAPGRLAWMVVFEALFATTVGWLVGLALGYSLNWIFGTWNILGPIFAAASDSFSSYGFGDEFYAVSKPIYALYASVTILFAGIFATFIPARKVAGLEPMNAMRDE